MFGITEISIDFLTGRPVVTVLFFILFVIFAVYLYRRTNPPLSRGMKILLTGLRIVAVVAVFLALMEPVLSYRREYERKARLTILVDHSKSMDIMENDLSRSARVDSVMESGELRDFIGNFDYETVPFAGLAAGEDNDNLDRDRTALGEVLTAMADRQIAAPAEAWLLFSDGISNSGIAPAEASARIKTPIFSIGVGIPAAEKDIALAGLDYNQIVFAGKPTAVTVHLEWQGMDNDRAKIQVRSGEKVLSEQEIKLPPGDLKDDIVLKFVPEKPGQQTFRVVIPGSPDEISADNNSRSFSVTVLKSKMEVLLVAPTLDWEYAFLNRFLSRSESVDLTRVVFKDNDYLTGSFPDQQTKLNRYDLIILCDIKPSALKSRKNLFDSFLKDKGGSILVLLGENYLMETWPRWLDDYLPFINTRRGSSLVYLKFNGAPAENYLFHPAVRIADNRQNIREAWRNLPNFEALVPIDSVAPNSEILVTADLGRAAMTAPIIGYRHFGGGRVLATAALPFWHWAFFGYGFGEEPGEYGRFFDGLVNWLSVREEAEPVRIIPDKAVYTRGEKVGFTAFAYDLGFRPIEGAGGYVAMAAENGKDTSLVQLIDMGEGKYRADFEILPSARYNYFAVAEKDGRRIKESSGQVAIEGYSIEEFRRRPDFENLNAVSRLTGGRFYPVNGIDSLYPVVPHDKITVTVQNEIVLWNKFWLLAIFILALGLEWFIRKRLQLI
nr:hypothetical protein [candidate division Zixibacteria bacterium]